MTPARRTYGYFSAVEASERRWNRAERTWEVDLPDEPGPVHAMWLVEDKWTTGAVESFDVD